MPARQEREKRAKQEKENTFFFWWGVLKGIKNFDDDDEDDAVVIGFPLSFLVFFFLLSSFLSSPREGEGREGSRSDLINLHRHTSKMKSFLGFLSLIVTFRQSIEPVSWHFFSFHLFRGENRLEENESRGGQKT